MNPTVRVRSVAVVAFNLTMSVSAAAEISQEVDSVDSPSMQ